MLEDRMVFLNGKEKVHGARRTVHGNKKTSDGMAPGYKPLRHHQDFTQCSFAAPASRGKRKICQ
jgi:hypothetical protein